MVPRSPGSKPRSGWTRDIGFEVELLADDNELANFHPPTARLLASRESYGSEVCACPVEFRYADPPKVGFHRACPVE
jgi:hypothetical protein